MSQDSPDIDAPRRSIGSRRNPDTEEAILAAAEAILDESGLAGFSIEAVARRARAGKPTIYRWWPDKTALLLAVYHRQKPAVVHADSGSTEEDVAQFFVHLMGHWGGSGAGEVFRYLVADAQSNPRTAETLSDYAAARRKQTGALFARGQARGELRDDIDPELAAELISALAWQRLLTGRTAITLDEARKIAHQVVQGLRPGASRS
ncbi:MAG: TetR/AcrR family transcriptional regulator [Alphaproteobacteria bacterium]|nr:TetR/AcrR family transcriptional regulator [Alphaproteobacteria bacterium]MBU1561138.1 TetR/AcrR family transcriptional regulator [Alphaproteobacteria bacterium]MBU2302477.1 TetR/AcrR family transcriptional regulator [Alphaproteobacteria bacterium]MBU2366625.1 TetR/AcrR family transcriptional regulator [Alphaproteobacteria bacterium]